MKTVCLVHGVGFFDDIHATTVYSFGKKFGDATDANVILYNWDHPGIFPEDDRNGFLFKKLRNFTYQVIMDFAYVVRNADYIAGEMPAADMYIGHSAGSIIMASRKTAPMVVMACPVQLLRNMQLLTVDNPILNIMHYRDPIAAVLGGATNVTIYDPLISSFLNPVKAHTGYWTSDAVLKKSVEWYKKYVGV